MPIEVAALELYGLATALRAAGAGADELAARLAHPARVGPPLRAAVDELLESHRTAARALAGELCWLAGTVAEVADSWLDLDASVLTRPGRAAAR